MQYTNISSFNYNINIFYQNRKKNHNQSNIKYYFNEKKLSISINTLVKTKILTLLIKIFTLIFIYNK